MFTIRSLSDLESISSAAKWQYFEKLVAWIFEQNDFDVRQGVVIKTSEGKRQFDVIASRYDKIFLVECKKWKSKSERKSALRAAAKKHIEKCMLYEEEKTYGRIIPLIVTLAEEDIEMHDNVIIVPIKNLNWLINSIEEYSV